MKIRTLMEGRRPFLSLEFFPPKAREQWPGFFAKAELLARLSPLFASVTYGAGGGTQDNTRDVATRMRRQLGLPTMAHLTCVGASRDRVARFVDGLLADGVDNVLALRGDAPAAALPDASSDFAHASDLVEFLARGWPELGLAVACYPEAHPESPTVEQDLAWTRRKLDAGADFGVTQLFFDVRRYQDFAARLGRLGAAKPLIPGVLPLLSMQSLHRILSLCGASIPVALYLELQEAQQQGGPAAVRARGVDIARRQMRELLALGAPGIHLYTLNNADACLEILAGVPELAGTAS